MQESTPKTYAIGLTGGIGSGKTTVSDLFRNLGVDVIDADEISHQLVSKDSPVLEKIRNHFGQDIIDTSGNLDRSSLRKKVFEDNAARTWLENLLHPEIRNEIAQRISLANSPYVIVVIPLLVESGSYDFLDRIAVVDAPEGQQVARVVHRDDSSHEQVERIMATQASRQQRLELADDIIDNSGSVDNLEHVVETLHEKYLQLAKQ